MCYLEPHTDVLTSLPLSTEEKRHNPKVENYVSLNDSVDFKPRVALKGCSKEVREQPGFIGVLQQRSGSHNTKRLLIIKENQIPRINEFSAFLYMGRCKSLGSLKSLLC